MQNPYKKFSSINPQRENGHRQISNHVFRALMLARLSGAEYQIAMTIIDRSWGFGKQSAFISLTQFEKVTSLSRQSVSIALKNMESRQIIAVHRPAQSKTNEYIFNKHFDTWLSSQPNHTTDKDKVVKLFTPEVVNQITLEQSTKSHYFSQPNHTTGSQVTEPSREPAKESIKETIKERNHVPEKEHGFNEQRKKIFEGLKDRRGYSSPVAGAEAKAITWMLNQGYSVEQILNAYDKLKKEKFWAEKLLNMQTVKTQIGELVKTRKGELPTTKELEEELEKDED